jgi:hypothetical protein
MRIIDLQDLIDKDERSKTDKKDKFDYFLCSRRGDLIVEPFKDESENNGLGVIVDEDMICDDADNDVERDSSDSNRESADQNDYPEEESNSDQASDEEAALKRYNKKVQQQVGPQQWLDRLRKKKAGATGARAMREQLENCYDSDGLDYKREMDDEMDCEVNGDYY